jgi:hypothetical protein
MFIYHAGHYGKPDDYRPMLGRENRGCRDTFKYFGHEKREDRNKLVHRACEVEATALVVGMSIARSSGAFHTVAAQTN